MNYGKLINGKLIEAPNILNKDGKQYINPPEELYLEYGYLPMEYTEIPDIKDGYHLIHSWSVNGNKLIQKWNYEINSALPIDELKNKINELEKTYIGSRNNPILYHCGLEVEDDKWYTDGSQIIIAIADGMPANFDDTNYFENID